MTPDRYIGLQEMKRRAMRALERGTENAAGNVKRDAEPLIPVDEGIARESLRQDPARRRGDTVSVDVEVGGGQPWYAPIVHQRTNVRHRVGQAKFLEEPLLRNVPETHEEIRQAARREF